MSEALSAPRLPICSICQEAVSLEAANTDEDGHAVHEDCYWARLKRNAGPAFKDRATRNAYQR